MIVLSLKMSGQERVERREKEVPAVAEGEIGWAILADNVHYCSD
jgi:hypothetical protein